MDKPRVTICVVPRERFSATSECLESVYAHTDEPFDLVYVDGLSPRPVRRYLDEQARLRSFRLVRAGRYLAPNEARNIGLERAAKEFVVFLDNDVVVSPGWLGSLLRCADDTGATVVSPLTYEGRLEDETIHMAGGEVLIMETTDGNGAKRRSVKERMYLPQRKAGEVREELKRRRCGLAEFHCVMVRREVFSKIGRLDERMLSTREHLDFCLGVKEAGGSIWVEPDSVVSYMGVPPLSLRDVPFYMLRWSDEWERQSLRHFQQKWRLEQDDFFVRRLQRVGWRRQEALIEPLAAKVTRGRATARASRLLSRADRALNRYVSQRHRRMSRSTGPASEVSV
jgi:GT2 family glycosyltransferase